MDYERLYQEAVEREMWLRDFSSITFNGSPLTVSLCGFEVKQFTLAHWGALRVARSPFVAEGEQPPINPKQIAQFLWIVSTGYPDSRKVEQAIVRYCGRLQIPRPPWIRIRETVKRWTAASEAALNLYRKTLAEIQEYMNDAFMDFPKGGPVRGLPKSYYSFTVGVVDTIASEYGWSREYIKSIPLAELSQYAKISRARDLGRAGKGPVMSNPSDAIIAEEARQEYAAVLEQEKNGN